MANNRYTSDELYHLVGRKNPSEHETNYQLLLKVLDSAHVSHYPHTPDGGKHLLAFNWDKNIISEELLVPTVTCYCDIPFESLGIHILKYGYFGLSFERDYLIRCGARPVIYIPLHHTQKPHFSWHGAEMLRDLEQTWKGFYEHLVEPFETGSRTFTIGQKPDSPELAAAALNNIITKEFLAYIKPFNAELTDDDPNNFYLEREWRMFGYLPFAPGTVKRVLVESNYVERLKKERPAYADKVEASPH